MTNQEPDRLDLETRIKQSTHPMHCKLGDVFVLMDAETGNYFELNATGSRLWEQVVSPVSIATLIRALVRDYEVDTATCEEQVLAWIGEMRTLGFIEIEPAVVSPD